MIRTDERQPATEAAEKVVVVHQRLVEFLQAGQTLAQVDAFVADTLRDLGAKSAFLGYRTGRYPRFPSHACLSVNDVIVHGTAGMSVDPLEPGDVFSIDIGVIYRGWIGDAAWTYVIESADEERTRLCRCGIEALQRGVEELRPGQPLLDWARAVQTLVEDDYSFHCVEGLGGHGYGRKLHHSPYVSNRVPIFPSEWPDANVRLRPGMLLAVEPMVAIGTGQLKQTERQWPIRTADGSLSVHYEHDVLIDESGPIVLTRELESLPMIVG
ncbi:MAG: type I methionyl aminopeptidase [Phycisphaerales bacterium]